MEVDDGYGGSGWKGKDVWWCWRKWVTKKTIGTNNIKKKRRGQWIVNLRKKRVEHEVGKRKERKKSVGKKVWEPENNGRTLKA